MAGTWKDSAATMEAGDAQHQYNVLLGPDDPRAPQPDRITVPMKPHQLAALQKARVMESEGIVRYNVPDPSAFMWMDAHWRHAGRYREQFEVQTNIGIVADIVGYGKTLTALAIIAFTPTEAIRRRASDVYSYFGRMYCHFTATCPRRMDVEVPPTEFINTTLVIVPRGPVYSQWQRAIDTQTRLSVLSIDSLADIRKKLPPPDTPPAQVRELMEAADVVLIKSTTLKTLLEYYRVAGQQHPIRGFDRVMVDEAHDILGRTPMLGFNYLWLLTATPRDLLDNRVGVNNPDCMHYAVKDLVGSRQCANLMLVRSCDDFVKQSFALPPQHDVYYLCELPTNLQAVQPFLNPSVQERINANDIRGAIRELGGQHETESDLVAIVTREIAREIANKEREIQFTVGLDMPATMVEARIASLKADLRRLLDKQTNLLERVSMLSNKTCSICYDTYDNPIMLQCTHVFCGKCLLSWMRAGHVCPECRAPIQSRKLIAVVENKCNHQAEASSSSSAQAQPQIVSKEDTLLRILTERPEGRFLVFSRCDRAFTQLVERMAEEGIACAELKGSTAVMMKTLNRFRSGDLRVIMLNTYHAGSGIDISCATDIVMYHSMGDHGVQAVGRAQRVGRTTELTVHHLCYPSELEDAQQQGTARPARETRETRATRA